MATVTGGIGYGLYVLAKVVPFATLDLSWLLLRW